MIVQYDEDWDFKLEARMNRIMRNTNKGKDEALEQARKELLEEKAEEAFQNEAYSKVDDSKKKW